MVFFSLSAIVLVQGLTAATDTSGSTFLWIAMLAGLLGLVFALFLARSVLAFDTGTAEVRKRSCRANTRPSPRWPWCSPLPSLWATSFPTLRLHWRARW